MFDIKMLLIPSTSHVSFSTIYEPAEDSFLLLDTLLSLTQLTWLRHRFPPQTFIPLVAEIGTGSGVMIVFVTAHAKVTLGRDDVLALGVNININACTATTVTV
jgi:release factor glutamine methyltransferase